MKDMRAIIIITTTMAGDIFKRIFEYLAIAVLTDISWVIIVFYL